MKMMFGFLATAASAAGRVHNGSPNSATPSKRWKFDIILIHLLAFDKNGHRVGYGKGFYDRYSALCRPDCLKIGISFFEATAPIDDVEAHDIALDIAICPTQVYDFR
jgi:5-formyltetrahydrofolate cyclo-ligase